MDKNQILAEITGIFRDVLDNDSIKLALDTTAADVEEWDSLSHIQLIVAIEKRYKIRFTTVEINQWKNIGDLIGSLENKLK